MAGLVIPNQGEVTFEDSCDLSTNEIVAMGYLDIPRSVAFLRSLGVNADLNLIKLYLNMGKISTYIYLDKAFSGVPVLNSNSSSQPSWLQDESKAVVKPGIVLAMQYKFAFPKNPNGRARCDGQPISIGVKVRCANSTVVNLETSESEVVNWLPKETILRRIAYLKVSELTELARSTSTTIDDIEGMQVEAGANCVASLREQVQQLEKERESLKEENERLKKESEKLKDAPTNSVYVAVGALLEMLTEQKTPRRNQAGIKSELLDKRIKGLSNGSMNSIFSDANKALKASKHED